MASGSGGAEPQTSMWNLPDSQDDEVETQSQSTAPLRRTLSDSMAAKITPQDLKGVDWWARPLKAAVAEQREIRGHQQRSLRVLTLCSGTEAPCLALEACSVLALRPPPALPYSWDIVSFDEVSGIWNPNKLPPKVVVEGRRT